MNSNTRRISLLAVVAAVAVTLALAVNLGGCASPGYYWQAASGHLALMRARQPVDQAIEEAELDPATLDKLRLSRQLRQFAVAELGMPDNGSYSEFVRTGRDAVVWNVVAAPEFSLEPERWCFPVSGCVPYRGYFEQEDAQRFAARLERKGLDVAVSPAIAYSTLGWFDDPLLDTMWRRSDTQFAAYLFHELAHQVIYVEGDAPFNEAYASFVERIGVERWLAHTGNRSALEDWRRIEQAGQAFDELLKEARAELVALYSTESDTAQMRQAKQAVFDRLRQNYRALRENQWQGRDYYGGWFDQPLNNARLALHDTYQGGQCAFERLFAEAGGEISRFHDLARDRAGLPDAQRRAWLEQPCASIAHGGEL